MLKNWTNTYCVYKVLGNVSEKQIFWRYCQNASTYFKVHTSFTSRCMPLPAVSCNSKAFWQKDSGRSLGIFVQYILMGLVAHGSASILVDPSVHYSKHFYVKKTPLSASQIQYIHCGLSLLCRVKGCAWLSLWTCSFKPCLVQKIPQYAIHTFAALFQCRV